MRRIAFFLFGMGFLGMGSSRAQPPVKIFTHADTLRGSITPERAWWDVLRYDIRVTPDFKKKSLRGQNAIRFAVLQSGRVMQIDLQQPMEISSVAWHKTALNFTRDGNVFYIHFPRSLRKGEINTLQINFRGHPKVAKQPPWDGGWVFTRDKKGRPWMSVACQELGASVWYPCKDHQGDEPDSGASLAITVPDSLVGVGNGRLKAKRSNGNGTTTYTWAVRNQINNYDIVPYIGKYVSWHEDYAGEKGRLDCDYWVLDYDLADARRQFAQVDTMLHCFEYWMGPYPFYEDGYKLVDAPFLGMEHQSAVAYGNEFANGYLKKNYYGSLSGMKFDFIIIHESGHEWFGNSITSADIADMWIHEAFTTYSEILYTTCLFGVEAGNEYAQSIRGRIRNDRPIIGPYGVNGDGSEDMYYKGSNMIHIIRQIIGDDSVFRGLLRGLTSTFYHQTVSTAQIETFISKYTHIDFSKVFDQYLRTSQVPLLEYRVDDKTRELYYHWAHCVKGFDMPVKVAVGGGAEQWIKPTETWQTLPGAGSASGAAGAGSVSGGTNATLSVDPNFYIMVKKTA